MAIRSRSFLPLSLLALCLAFAVPAQAATLASLQISFGSTPHWTAVAGTRVSVMLESERPGYDMFRYGGMYYAYSDDHWYRCRSARGNYILIEDRFVPTEFSRVPRGHWKHYPAAWGNRYDNGQGSNHDKANGKRNGRGNGKGH